MRAGTLAVAGVALGAAGWFARLPLLVGLGVAALVGVALAAALVGRRRVPVVHVPRVPRRVARGQSVDLDIAIEWPTARARWASLRDSSTGLRAWAEQATISWRVDTQRRGRFLVGPDAIEQADPIGIVRRELLALDKQTILVVPRVFDLHGRDRTATTDAYGTQDEQRGDEEFHTLREYVVGDERRHIHWRSSARSGTLLVCQNVAPVTHLTVVVLDTDERSYLRAGAISATLDEEAFERAVDWAASLSIGLTGPGREVVLATTSRGWEPRAVSSQSTGSLLEALAFVRATDGESSDVPRLTALLTRRRPRRVVVVSAGPSRRWESLRRTVRDLRVIHPSAPDGDWLTSRGAAA